MKTYRLTLQLRNVGVIWFLVHVPELLPISFTQQNSCCINKSRMKHMKKLDWKSDLPCFSYGYWNCMFLDFVTGYIVLPIVFTIECRVVIII